MLCKNAYTWLDKGRLEVGVSGVKTPSLETLETYSSKHCMVNKYNTLSDHLSSDIQRSWQELQKCNCELQNTIKTDNHVCFQQDFYHMGLKFLSALRRS